MIENRGALLKITNQASSTERNKEIYFTGKSLPLVTCLLTNGRPQKPPGESNARNPIGEIDRKRNRLQGHAAPCSSQSGRNSDAIAIRLEQRTSNCAGPKRCFQLTAQRFGAIAPL